VSYCITPALALLCWLVHADEICPVSSGLMYGRRRAKQG
jgi:hypothetical protein